MYITEPTAAKGADSWTIGPVNAHCPSQKYEAILTAANPIKNEFNGQDLVKKPKYLLLELTKNFF